MVRRGESTFGRVIHHAVGKGNSFCEQPVNVQKAPADEILGTGIKGE